MPKINLENSTNGSTAKSNTTGLVTVPSNGASTLIASFLIAGIGKMAINGLLSTGLLSDLIFAFATAVPSTLPGNGASGTSVPRLVASAGDFAVTDDLLISATAQPQSTTAGNGFYADLNLGGRFHRLDIYAKSTTVNTAITIDATAVGSNVG